MHPVTPRTERRLARAPPELLAQAGQLFTPTKAHLKRSQSGYTLTCKSRICYIFDNDPREVVPRARFLPFRIPHSPALMTISPHCDTGWTGLIYFVAPFLPSHRCNPFGSVQAFVRDTADPHPKPVMP